MQNVTVTELLDMFHCHAEVSAQKQMEFCSPSGDSKFMLVFSFGTVIDISNLDLNMSQATKATVFLTKSPDSHLYYEFRTPLSLLLICHCAIHASEAHNAMFLLRLTRVRPPQSSLTTCIRDECVTGLEPGTQVTVPS